MEETFCIAATLPMLAAVFAVASPNPTRALLHLVVFLLAAGVIFYTFGAALKATLETNIYVGANMVSFVVMLLRLNAHTLDAKRIWVRPDMLTQRNTAYRGFPAFGLHGLGHGCPGGDRASLDPGIVVRTLSVRGRIGSFSLFESAGTHLSHCFEQSPRNDHCSNYL